jgi:hypothetical protein
MDLLTTGYFHLIVSQYIETQIDVIVHARIGLAGCAVNLNVHVHEK